jgi:hypothetical protein
MTKELEGTVGFYATLAARTRADAHAVVPYHAKLGIGGREHMLAWGAHLTKRRRSPSRTRCPLDTSLYGAWR